MADWYVSSAKYATLALWQATHAYVIGDIVRPTAPAISAQHVFRCTVAGTSAASEPTWTTTNNSTRTDGTVTWTCVSGQSAYGWNAAAGTLISILNTRSAVGERFFLSSDHSESSTATSYPVNNSTNAFGLVQVISVNRAGSVPPVEADIQSGAAVGVSSGNLLLEAFTNVFWQGITLSSTAGGVAFNSAALKSIYLKNCQVWCNNATGTSRILTGAAARVTFDNTTVRFGATGQAINSGTAGTAMEIIWINTASAIAGATIPTTLFNNTGPAELSVTCRGVDLSAITGTLTAAGTSLNMTKVLLDSCKIASGVARYGTPGIGTVAHDEVELVNCYDGSNIINERHTAPGVVTMDRSTTLSGGAQDDIGLYSLKLVSSARSDFATLPLDCFVLDVENTATGASKTATVEIISSGTLNNTDIKLQLQYMGTAGSSIASFVESLASVMTTSAALGSSSATWNSPPGTPQKQLLQVTFTPQTAGRVRGLVRLGKVSTTVWVNPQITIS